MKRRARALEAREMQRTRRRNRRSWTREEERRPPSPVGVVGWKRNARVL
jgi:hypothetical protein